MIKMLQFFYLNNVHQVRGKHKPKTKVKPWFTISSFVSKFSIFQPIKYFKVILKFSFTVET